MTTHMQAKAKGTLSEDDRKKIVSLLQKAYNMEIETVANYIANSIHLDGMLATEVKESLAADVTEELGHAQKLATRIKVLGGHIPGSQDLHMEQTTLQPPTDSIDVEKVIRGVVDAEQCAVEHYQQLIEATDGLDWVTQDLCIEIKGDEEEHRREFIGFLRGYEAMRKTFSGK